MSGSDESIETHATALADGIEEALPKWVVRSVTTVVTAWAGEVSPEVAEAADVAGRQARDEAGASVRALLLSDIDDQRTTPLALLRSAVKYPTGPWDFVVRDGAFSDRDAGGRVIVFRVHPVRGLGFRKGDRFSQTTWRGFR